MLSAVGLKTLAAWLLAIMLAVQPPGKSVVAQETVDAGTDRYRAIAGAIATVASDPEESPLFVGKDGRARTAVLMLSVAYFESGFRRDVDLGEGKLSKGDTGRSCGLFQAFVGRGKTLEGWTCADLTADRVKAARSALHSMRRSQGACRALGVEGMLRVYASGSCERGEAESTARVRLAAKWLRLHPWPKESE